MASPALARMADVGQSLAPLSPNLAPWLPRLGRRRPVCRLCHRPEGKNAVNWLLIETDGRRIHADCGIRKYGPNWLSRLPTKALEDFSITVAQREGILDRLQAELKGRYLFEKIEPR